MPRPGPIVRFAHRVRAVFRMASMTWNGYGGAGYGWRLLLPGTQFDYEAAAGDLWRNSAAAACLRWIRINFPEPLLEAVLDGADGIGGRVEVLKRHDCVDLLNRPNPFYDRYTFWAAMSLSAIVDGNAYALKIRSAAGRVVQLWWIPHWLIWPRWKQDGTEFIGWYEYSVNGRTIKVPPSEVIHYRQGIDPRDDRKGFSELKQTVRAVCGLNEADTYTAAIMRNLGIIGAIVSFDGNGVMQPDDVSILQDQFRQEFTSEGRGNPLFSPRNMKVVKLGMTPEEMRLDKLPARLEDQVCAAIGLPPMVVGMTSGAATKTYANYGEARRAAYEDCLIPMQKSVAECLTHQLLLPDFTGADRLRWNYASVQCLSENETEVATRVGMLYQTYQVIRRSEARAAIGQDYTEEDEVYFGEVASGQLPVASEEDPEEEPEGEETEKPKGSRVNRVLGLLEKRLNGDGNWHADD